MPQSSQNPDRGAYVAALRQFADWLEQHPEYGTPTTSQLLLPLTTNSAVEEFAAAHGLAVQIDDDGNASTDVKFGPISYHAYGYEDFAAFCKQNSENQARTWAERNDMVIQPREDESTVKEPFPARGGHAELCAYVSGMTTRCTCSEGGAR